MAMAWPLVVLGAFQLIIGLTVALRTPAQVAALEEGFRKRASGDGGSRNGAHGVGKSQFPHR
jgi:hypothetical protein